MVAIHKPAHDVILKPVVSEKSLRRFRTVGKYTFVVGPGREQGARSSMAIEEIFKRQGDDTSTPSTARARR